MMSYSILVCDYTLISIVFCIFLALVIPLYFIYRYYQNPEQEKIKNLIYIITAISCGFIVIITVNSIFPFVISKSPITTDPFIGTNLSEQKIENIVSYTSSQLYFDYFQNQVAHSSNFHSLYDLHIKISDLIALILFLGGIFAGYIYLLTVIRNKMNVFSKISNYKTNDEGKILSLFFYLAGPVILGVLVFIEFFSQRMTLFEIIIVILTIFQLIVVLICYNFLMARFTESGCEYHQVQNLLSSLNMEGHPNFSYILLPQIELWTFLTSILALIMVINLKFSMITFFIVIVGLVINHSACSAILNLPRTKYGVYLKNNPDVPAYSDVFILDNSPPDVLRIITQNFQNGSNIISIMKDTVSHYDVQIEADCSEEFLRDDGSFSEKWDEFIEREI